MSGDYLLPVPESWDTFEKLCFMLWKNIWGDKSAHIHGRRGQDQSGVDIYGIPPFSSDYVGIQCKAKNKFYGSVLTKKEVEEECVKAIDFKPPLKDFIIATTSPRDVGMQDYCRNIHRNLKVPFSVDVWAWEDIEEEVRCWPDIMDRFYNNHKNIEVTNKISIPPDKAKHKLRAFFSRPGILNGLNKAAIKILDSLAQEMAINAYGHGNASYFRIEVEGNTVQFRDNGKRFNPLELLSDGVKKRGGGLTLQDARALFKIEYVYKEENILNLECSGLANTITEEEVYSIILDVEDLFGHQEAYSTMVQEFARIPLDAKKIIIDISGKNNICRSGSLGLLKYLKDYTDDDQMVVVFLPLGLYYAQDLIEMYKSVKRIKFIEKDKLANELFNTPNSTTTEASQ